MKALVVIGCSLVVALLAWVVVLLALDLYERGRPGAETQDVVTRNRVRSHVQGLAFWLGVIAGLIYVASKALE